MYTEKASESRMRIEQTVNCTRVVTITDGRGRPDPRSTPRRQEYRQCRHKTYTSKGPFSQYTPLVTQK